MLSTIERSLCRNDIICSSVHYTAIKKLPLIRARVLSDRLPGYTKTAFTFWIFLVFTVIARDLAYQCNILEDHPLTAVGVAYSVYWILLHIFTLIWGHAMSWWESGRFLPFSFCVPCVLWLKSSETITTTNITLYGEICSLLIYFRLFSEEWNTGMSRGVIVALYKLWKHLENFSVTALNGRMAECCFKCQIDDL
jgi:hypothetical protein